MIAITAVGVKSYQVRVIKISEVFCICRILYALRKFAPIVSGHPYCARNSLRDVMPRHALSARAVEEMWRYIALVGTLISMHGFNSLKCSVTPYFLLIDHFLCRLSTFCEKLKKICIVEV